jgi:uncharacterized protein
MAGNEVFILAGALVGGYVSGLMGFGTGLAALIFWLHVIQPIVAAPLVLICSIIAQIQTLPAIWHAVVWRRILPFILGGLVGVPIGTKLLDVISLQEFKLLIGCLLIVSCSFMLLRRSPIAVSWGGKIVDGVVGFAGGILGGLAGLSGSLPMIWVSLRGWGKDEKRGVIQTFNLSVLLFAMSSQAIGGYITMEVGRLTLIAFPGILLGAWMGRKTYDRLGEGRFNQIVLVLLLLSGILTIVTSV